MNGQERCRKGRRLLFWTSTWGEPARDWEEHSTRGDSASWEDRGLLGLVRLRMERTDDIGF
jgi:hypothetical protein